MWRSRHGGCHCLGTSPSMGEGGVSHSRERGKAFWAKWSRDRMIQGLVFVFPPIFLGCVSASKAQKGLMKTTLKSLTVETEISQLPYGSYP